MRYVMSLFGAAAVLVVMAAISLGGTTPVSAAVLTMQGTAVGAEENPPVAGAGTVQVRFTFNDQTNVLTYSATVNGISPAEVTASHIHRGAKGVNGPIVYPLSTTSFSSVQGQITLTAADVADLKAGNFYFNAHSNANPGGFARFQLVLPAAPAAPSAPAASPPSNAAPRPPVTGDGGLIGRDEGTSALPMLAGAAVLSMMGIGGLVYARRRI
jgi:hypothetical protein